MYAKMDEVYPTHGCSGTTMGVHAVTCDAYVK